MPPKRQGPRVLRVVHGPPRAERGVPHLGVTQGPKVDRQASQEVPEHLETCKKLA